MAIIIPSSPVLNTDYTVTTVTTSSSNTSIVGTLPSGRSNGNLLLYFLSSQRNVASALSAVPAGCQLFSKRDSGSTTYPYEWIYYRFVDGTEETAPTFTWATGDGGDDVLEVFVVKGTIDSTTPLGAVSAFANNSSVSPASAAITTTGPNSVCWYRAIATNGNRITAANSNYPSGSTGLYADKSRALSVGVVYGNAFVNVPTSGTSIGSEAWTNFLNNAATAWTAVAFEIKSSSAGIVSVNGGAGVAAGSTGNTLVTTSGFTPTSITIGGIAATNIAGTSPNFTFDFPLYTDENVWPLFGNQTLIASNGGTSANFTVATRPQAGYNFVTLSGSIITSVNGVVYNFSPAALVTDQIVFDSTVTSVLSDASASTSYTGTQTLWHLKASTGIIRSYALITGTGITPPVVVPTKVTMKSGYYQAQIQMSKGRNILPYLPDSTATTVNEFKTDLNALLVLMRNAGWF